MSMVKLDVEVPEELLSLFSESGLSALDGAGQIRAVLAIHLFLVGEISLGKAAELSGEERGQFGDLLLRLGLPLVRYDEEDYRQDMDDASKRTRARERQAEFTRLAARADREAPGPEPTEGEIVQEVKETRGAIYRERYGEA